jgi:hypothetical protein
MSSLFPNKPSIAPKPPTVAPAAAPTSSVALPKSDKEIGPFLGVVEHGTVGYIVYGLYTTDGRVTRIENLNPEDGEKQRKPISRTAALDIFRTHSVKNFWGKGGSGTGGKSEGKK